MGLPHHPERESLVHSHPEMTTGNLENNQYIAHQGNCLIHLPETTCWSVVQATSSSPSSVHLEQFTQTPRCQISGAGIANITKGIFHTLWRDDPAAIEDFLHWDSHDTVLLIQARSSGLLCLRLFLLLHLRVREKHKEGGEWGRTSSYPLFKAIVKGPLLPQPMQT